MASGRGGKGVVRELDRGGVLRKKRDRCLAMTGLNPFYSRSHFMVFPLAIIDILSLLLGSLLGISLRFGPDDVTQYVYQHAEGWLLLFSAVILANYLAGSYRLQYTFSHFNLFVTWLFSLTFAMLILSVTSYSWLSFVLGRGVLFFSLAAYSLLALILKSLFYRTVFNSRMYLYRAAILGTDAVAAATRVLLENKWVIPHHEVVAFVEIDDGVQDFQAGSTETKLGGAPVYRVSGAGLASLIQTLGVSLLVVSADAAISTRKLYATLKRLRLSGVNLLNPMTVAEVYSGRIPVDLLSEEFMMQATLESGIPGIWRVKRLVDVLISCVGLVLLAPLCLLAAVLIKAENFRAPVIYSQMRVGRFGIPFKIHKFRSMRPDAEEETGAVWALPYDERVTRVGRWLRKFRIDEIPQFIDVLRGDMSIVGPRPERPEIGARLAREIPFYDERVNVMPGITGWAQIQYPYGSSVQDAQRKLEYDLYYIKHASLSLDLQIVLRTLRIVFFAREWSA